MTNKLFVGSLSWDTTEQTLHDLFSQYGQVQSVTIITDKYSGKSRGFGFVEMATEEEAEKAQHELNGKEVDGRAIAVSEAKPPQPRDSGDRYGGNRDRHGSNRRNSY